MGVQGLRGRRTIVVIPCYNESNRLDGEALLQYAASHPDIGFLLVDDGSTDSTRDLLAGLSERLPEAVAWEGLARNSGKAEAVRQGVLAALTAQPDRVAYWDADLATPLRSLDKFLAAMDANPALLGVFGCRVRRLGAAIDRRPLRHYAGRIFATLASLTLGMAVYDTQCGAKLFRAGPELASAFSTPFLSPWIFDVEVLARLRAAMAPSPLAPVLMELPLDEWEDVAGSKLTTSRGARAFLDLLLIARRYR